MTARWPATAYRGRTQRGSAAITSSPASWRVDDLEAELTELRSRGVEIDTPELKTDNGIVDTGDALHAWFVDPGNNTVGIDQYK